MISQKQLIELGFELTGEYRRYSTYTKDGINVSVNKFKILGEYTACVTINGEMEQIKTIQELNELLK